MRASGWQFFIREADAEAAGIILAHFLVRVRTRCPFAIARDIHTPDVKARIAIHHPLRERETDAAALAEARHHGACDPVIRETLHGADERIAVWREGERAVDDFLNARFRHGGEMLVTDFKRWRDAVEIWLQQFRTEIPRGRLRRPRHTCALICAKHHAGTLLAHIDFSFEIDGMRQFMAALFIVSNDFRHLVGYEIHVLHREHRQFDADHAADFTRPETTTIHNMFGDDRALIGNDIPTTILALVELFNLCLQIDFSALNTRRFCVSMRSAVRIEIAIGLIKHGADEFRFIEQRQQIFCFLHRNQFGFEAEITRAGMRHFKPIHALGCIRKHQTAGAMETAAFARDFLKLVIERNRIALELGDIRIAIQRVETARRMPCRAMGQLLALNKHDIFPARFGEMVENRSANNAAPNDDNTGMGFHRDPVLSKKYQ